MSGRLLLAALAALLMLAPRARARAREGPDFRRFVITVAADDGGPARAPLRYAGDDARAMSAVLRELGGVDDDALVALVRPTAAALRTALLGLKERLKAALRDGARTEVVFYYSGHSDETALLLASERLEYAELRRLLDALPADVRIAILDSCASGAFTRLKGGMSRPPFMIDASTKVKGHAFLTSSSADEAAQESDRIGGSFFTHYLVSGLRGAADESGDRKVTLTEAYRFAFEETLSRTAQTQFGSQHPAFEIRLVGTGDLVMTDLRGTSAELTLDEALEGRLFVWDGRGHLAVEVDKPRGRVLSIGVSPGSYRLELTRDGRSFAGKVSADAGTPRRVGADALTEVARETTLARGIARAPTLRPLAASLLPPLSTNYLKRPGAVRNYVDLALLYDHPAELAGLQLALVGGTVRAEARGVQLAGLFATAPTVYGAQLSLGMTVAEVALHGIQVATTSFARDLAGVQLGGLSWAERVVGAQLGGLNLAREVRGMQLGGLNVAAGKVEGLQLGLVNYADEADVSLGALAVTKKGGAHLQLLVSDLLAPELLLRLEANYNYSFLSVGIAPFGAADAFLLGTGLGIKAPLRAPYLWLDVDLSGHLVEPQWDFQKGVPNSLFQLRMLARLALHARLGIVLGPTFNALLQLDSDERLTPGLSLKRWSVQLDSDGARLLCWLGFAVGVRI